MPLLALHHIGQTTQSYENFSNTPNFKLFSTFFFEQHPWANLLEPWFLKKRCFTPWYCSDWKEKNQYFVSRRPNLEFIEICVSKMRKQPKKKENYRTTSYMKGQRQRYTLFQYLTSETQKMIFFFKRKPSLSISQVHFFHRFFKIRLRPKNRFIIWKTQKWFFLDIFICIWQDMRFSML